MLISGSSLDHGVANINATTPGQAYGGSGETVQTSTSIKHQTQVQIGFGKGNQPFYTVLRHMLAFDDIPVIQKGECTNITLSVFRIAYDIGTINSTTRRYQDKVKFVKCNWDTVHITNYQAIDRNTPYDDDVLRIKYNFFYSSIFAGNFGCYFI